jgi:hypothetical protein
MNDHAGAPLVRIHINREPYHSPNPTTGEALYQLGHLGERQGLIRSVNGDKEDQFIPRDTPEIHLHEDEHFYSEEVVTIFVEGISHQWPEGEISYVQVVTLEVPDYAKHPEITYSVTYKNGPRKKPEGVLAPGASVKVKEGMTFNVSDTGQS